MRCRAAIGVLRVAVITQSGKGFAGCLVLSGIHQLLCGAILLSGDHYFRHKNRTRRHQHRCCNQYGKKLLRLGFFGGLLSCQKILLLPIRLFFRLSGAFVSSLGFLTQFLHIPIAAQVFLFQQRLHIFPTHAVRTCCPHFLLGLSVQPGADGFCLFAVLPGLSKGIHIIRDGRKDGGTPVQLCRTIAVPGNRRLIKRFLPRPLCQCQDIARHIAQPFRY